MSFPKIKPAYVLFPFTEILKWNNVCVVYQSNGLDVINFFLRNYVILAISNMSLQIFICQKVCQISYLKWYTIYWPINGSIPIIYRLYPTCGQSKKLHIYVFWVVIIISNIGYKYLLWGWCFVYYKNTKMEKCKAAPGTILSFIIL